MAVASMEQEKTLKKAKASSQSRELQEQKTGTSKTCLKIIFKCYWSQVPWQFLFLFQQKKI